MKTTAPAVLLAAALSLAACHKSADNATDNSVTANDMAGNGTSDYSALNGSTPSAATTPDFVTKAAISDMYETRASKIALTRSKSAAIKTFAQKMIHDHGETTAEVKSIVAKDKLTPPPASMDDDHAKLIDDLTSAKPDEFDALYVDQQTTAHKDALDLMQGYAAGGDNPDLKAFATKTAPKIQGHLDMVKTLDKSGADEGVAKPATPAQ